MDPPSADGLGTLQRLPTPWTRATSSLEIFQGEELSAYGIGDNGNVVIDIT
jgi:hypothetical protein